MTSFLLPMVHPSCQNSSRICSPKLMWSCTNASQCLSLGSTREKNAISVQKQSYPERCSSRIGIENCNFVGTPSTLNADPNLHLHDELLLDSVEHHLFRSLLGDLRFLLPLQDQEINVFGICAVQKFTQSFRTSSSVCEAYMKLFFRN